MSTDAMWIQWTEDAKIPEGDYWICVKRENGTWETAYYHVRMNAGKAIMSNGESTRDISWWKESFDCWLYKVVFPRRPGDDEFADRYPGMIEAR